MAQEQKEHAWWYYLIGCSPVTLGLLCVVVVLVSVPVLFFPGPPDEPRRTGLPQLAEKRSSILAGGEWRWTEDVDGDGRVDCLRRVGSMKDAFYVPEHKAACLRGTLGTLSRLAGPRVLEDPLRARLSAVHVFKFARRWTPATTLDTDGDGQVDCVAESTRRGLVLRRGSADCPGAAHSLPEPLESHPLLAEFQQLLELEDASRKELARIAAPSD